MNQFFLKLKNRILPWSWVRPQLDWKQRELNMTLRALGCPRPDLVVGAECIPRCGCPSTETYINPCQMKKLGFLQIPTK